MWTAGCHCIAIVQYYGMIRIGWMQLYSLLSHNHSIVRPPQTCTFFSGSTSYAFVGYTFRPSWHFTCSGRPIYNVWEPLVRAVVVAKQPEYNQWNKHIQLNLVNKRVTTALPALLPPWHPLHRLAHCGRRWSPGRSGSQQRLLGQCSLQVTLLSSNRKRMTCQSSARFLAACWLVLKPSFACHN